MNNIHALAKCLSFLCHSCKCRGNITLFSVVYSFDSCVFSLSCHATPLHITTSGYSSNRWILPNQSKFHLIQPEWEQSKIHCSGNVLLTLYSNHTHAGVCSHSLLVFLMMYNIYRVLFFKMGLCLQVALVCHVIKFSRNLESCILLKPLYVLVNNYCSKLI